MSQKVELIRFWRRLIEIRGEKNRSDIKHRGVDNISKWKRKSISIALYDLWLIAKAIALKKQ